MALSSYPINFDIPFKFMYNRLNSDNMPLIPKKLYFFFLLVCQSCTLTWWWRCRQMTHIDRCQHVSLLISNEKLFSPVHRLQ